MIDPLLVRSVRDDDVAFLWEMLFRASWSHLDSNATVEGLATHPELARYVTAWGRQGDHGVVAEDAKVRVGAAWVRLFSGEDVRAREHVADDVPELAIAVLEGREGRGVGDAMLRALLEVLGERYPAIALSVRESNPAVRLYRRHGFEIIDEIENRVGSRSLKMLRRLRT